MRDMILVERVTDGERCQYVGANPGYPTEGRKGCPFLIACDEEVVEHYALHTYYFCMTFQERLLSSFTKTPCRLEITRCPACLATPSAVVLTDEMVEAVTYCASGVDLAYNAVLKGLYDEALLHLGHHGVRIRKALDALERDE